MRLFYASVERWFKKIDKTSFADFRFDWSSKFSQVRKKEIIGRDDGKVRMSFDHVIG